MLKVFEQVSILDEEKMRFVVMDNNCAHSAFGWHCDSKYIRGHQADERRREARVGRSVFVWRWPFFHFRFIIQFHVLMQ